MDDFIRLILDYALAHDGGTFNVQRKEIFESKTGYIVAVDGEILDELSREAVEYFICYYRLKRRNMLGLWKNPETSQWHIDVSVWMGYLPSAMVLARDRDQLAIWDCGAQEVIEVNS